ncbi:hypothetical protein [Novipirellula artificiosorum]|uniref:Uncharacterized protein n=1 Tax=Novipirellula artificiosorum TaxID=2528016 RepID=A0A5C6DWG0_9BACT|nr:hypothetical protein [Novipirellula artificiosorum]TWU39741.1 hypothetical protein Poly41_25970 [Novipirellula artificiosorum]
MSDRATTPTRVESNRATRANASRDSISRRRLQLSQSQAAAWLCYLNQRLTSEQPRCESLDELRAQLADACWLARWKREQVDLEFCLSLLPGLTESLLGLSQQDQDREDFDVLEDMIRAVLVEN